MPDTSMPLPGPKASYLPSWSSLKFAGRYTCTPGLWEITDSYLLQQPGTQAVSCCPTLAAGTEPLTHAGLPSNWFCGHTELLLQWW